MELFVLLGFDCKRININWNNIESVKIVFNLQTRGKF